MANTLRVSDSVIEIHYDANDTQTKEKLSRFYPVHYNRKGTEAKLSARFMPEVLETFRGVTERNITTAPQRIQDLYWNEMHAREAIDSLLQYGHKGSPVVNEHLTLMRHQQLGREIAEIRDRFCFFFDTRTGKTPLSLSIIHDDLQVNPHHKWLIVCPLILIENAWMEDAAKFLPDVKVVNCHASTKAKRLKAMATNAQIYVTNTESFVSYRQYFDKIGFEGCFVDESSDMKSHKSKQSKELVDFAQTLKRFYLLSGTPAPNGEWEYYMQLKAIDFYSVPMGVTQFKEKYFYNTSYNPQYEKLKVKPEMFDELMEHIKKYAIYVDKEDVLTTPGRTFHEVKLEMPKDLMAHYRKLKNELYLEIGDTQIIAPSAAAKLNKLNQVSSGFVIDTQAVKENKFYDDSKVPEWYMLDDYRFKKLQDLLSSDNVRDQQVLIWANYRKEFELIQNLLGERCRCVYGGTTLADKNENIRLFKSGQVQYLIANPASADKGLTLTNAHISIYFSLNWSYELFKQSMERIYGDISKQSKHCDYYVFLAEGTIDEVLYYDVLQGKGNASKAVLDHLKGGL